MTGSQASRITYTLDSSLDSVNRVEQTAEQVAQKAGFDDDEVFRVSMAAREAAVNAVREILNAAGGVTGSLNLMNARRMLSMVEKYPEGRVPAGCVMPASRKMTR